MDSFEYNKLIGALLGTVFFIMTVGLVSNSLFHSPAPEKPGYAIEVAEESGAAQGGAEAPQVEPIAARLASADVAKGQAEFKKCQACHSGEKGGPNKVGPDLWEVVDRPIATHEGFSFSAGMKEFSNGGAEKWTYDHLDHFLTSPKNYVKGTAMSFAGIKDPQNRANVIAYLRSLADTPEPLPEVPAEGAPAEGAPAEGAAQPETAPAQPAPQQAPAQ